MRQGYFDNINKEYVIETPNTPLPWINYLGESDYCALISNTAGGYSFYKDPRERRITRYRYDNIPFDSNGRYIYIKDNESGEFFSPTWEPCQTSLDTYECKHGLGYTKVQSSKFKVQSTITYFVPLNENLEVWKLEIRNTSNEIRDLSLFSFVEFCLWDAVGDANNFQRTWSIGKAHCEGNTIIHDTQYGSWVDIFAYFSCSEPIHSFDCQRKAFLGNNGYNPLSRPEAVVRDECSNSTAIGWSPIGAHCVKIKLNPGESKTILFTLGVSKSKKIKTFSIQEADEELEKIKKYWEENLSKLQIETPDSDMNTTINIWNQYQCLQTFNWSRYASYYESGIGRGMGFRDSCQDTLGFCHIIPDQVRRRILDLAAIQFEDGSTYHQYSPLTKKGALLGYSDDPHWLIIAVANYIKETGDFSILKEKVPFAPYEPMVPAQVGHHDNVYKRKVQNAKRKIKVGTLYEHLKRGIEFSWKNRGPHGLPLSKFSDWNDCLNMTGPNGKAESVLVGEMLVHSCNLMIEMLGAKGVGIGAGVGKAEEKVFGKIAIQMTVILNKHGWDGAWYRRAYDDAGKPVGSNKNKEGKIYLETQPWGVMSGAAEGKRAMECMDSVYEKLFSKHGIILQQPALTKYYPEHGEISTYPPGLKENASIFCHPNPWAMVAECILGRGDRAFEYYKAILPAAQNEIAETRKIEPYVYCQMVAGPDHPDFGEGKNSWLTGSAAWNLYAASQYILGIRPSYDGIIIDPCIPSEWKELEVRRVVRGSVYNIKIKNPDGRQKRVKFLKIDGEEITGNVIPYYKKGKEHAVEVVLG
ncbi:hypothetical protein A2276_08020 [candidate division WOR-1 bacterium RIFOXYA12_FULL_43_27]|uniref:Uncharacterized protein n=1 Tax=candidate division WOR-1 bacterium RIFOXYC2_FULL_46_14 TaxID=1802587 RepID=A0A1F4U6D7_UNCSA|nr:MAG: hypothetical protein A2276_08020 [candidate division WOR-1 bacterium RIFOXYA12_FULL_43_27]OGC20950.1 MAG: hypothetical protein A2292_05845 [candidate division WOR-1 bacterium RIFOXYB2_FULL_46_45]OGC32290.1 MAG: hypothetical protein A2232_05605 [candidate division WOR-1 bacterium RIFOXYA2_FULL_46_56]OGC40506.1 MAG: hypothetical protein A2438_03875 [candidate division WOR-1 bacterium RIFOXYC2_FULL_46_14]